MFSSPMPPPLANPRGYQFESTENLLFHYDFEPTQIPYSPAPEYSTIADNTGGILTATADAQLIGGSAAIRQVASPNCARGYGCLQLFNSSSFSQAEAEVEWSTTPFSAIGHPPMRDTTMAINILHHGNLTVATEDLRLLLIAHAGETSYPAHYMAMTLKKATRTVRLRHKICVRGTNTDNIYAQFTLTARFDAQIQDGEWTHLAVVSKGGENNLIFSAYKDGVKVPVVPLSSYECGAGWAQAWVLQCIGSTEANNFWRGEFASTITGVDNGGASLQLLLPEDGSLVLRLNIEETKLAEILQTLNSVHFSNTGRQETGFVLAVCPIPGIDESVSGRRIMMIGGHDDSQRDILVNRSFTGALDDARLYNRALTQEQIQALVPGEDACTCPSGTQEVSAIPAPPTESPVNQIFYWNAEAYAVATADGSEADMANFWPSSCEDVPCPALDYVEGTSLRLGCACRPGTLGTISLLHYSPYYSISGDGCLVVECPVNSSDPRAQGDGDFARGKVVDGNCQCDLGFTGNVYPVQREPGYETDCSGVACPAHSSGADVPSGCTCWAGYQVTPTNPSASPLSGTITPPST